MKRLIDSCYAIFTGFSNLTAGLSCPNAPRLIHAGTSLIGYPWTARYLDSR